MANQLTAENVVFLIARSIIQSNSNVTSVEMADTLRAINYSVIEANWLALASDVDIRTNWAPPKMVGCFDSDSYNYDIIRPLLLSKDSTGAKQFPSVFALLKNATSNAPQTGCLDLADVSKLTAAAVSEVSVPDLVNILYRYNVTDSAGLAAFKTALTSLADGASFAAPSFGTTLATITAAQKLVLSKIIELKPETPVKTLIDTFNWQMIAAAGISPDVIKIANVSVSSFITFIGDATVTESKVAQQLYGFPSVSDVAKSNKYPLFLAAKYFGFSASDLLTDSTIKNAVLTIANVLSDFKAVFPEWLPSISLLDRFYGLRSASGVLGTTLTTSLLTDAEKSNVGLLYNIVNNRPNNGITALSANSVTGVVAPSSDDLLKLAILKQIKITLGITFEELFNKVPELSEILARNFSFNPVTKAIVSNGIKFDGTNVMNVGAATEAGSLAAANYFTQAQVDIIILRVAGSNAKLWYLFNTAAADTLAEGVTNLKRLGGLFGGLGEFLRTTIPTPNKNPSTAETAWTGTFSVTQIAVAYLLTSDIKSDDLNIVIDYLSENLSDARTFFTTQLGDLTVAGNKNKLKAVINKALDNSSSSQLQKLVLLFGSTVSARVAVLFVYADNSVLITGQDEITRMARLFVDISVTELVGSGKLFGATLLSEYGSGLADARTNLPTKQSDLVPYLFRNSEADMRLIKENNLASLQTLLSYTVTRKSLNPITGLIGENTAVLAYDLPKLRRVYGVQQVDSALSEVYTTV